MRNVRLWKAAALILLLGVSAVVGAVGWVVVRRPARTELSRELGPGIVYERSVLDAPRPNVVHTVRVDLDQPGIEFLVTPPAYPTGKPFAAMTVQQFVDRYDLTVAVNGDYFEPQHCRHPLDYYPRANDPVAAQGLSASGGLVSRPAKPGYFGKRDCTLYISRDNQVTFEESAREVRHAISGGPILVRDGAVAEFPDSTVVPQTAVGFSSADNRLLLMVVDGRQSGYSEGLTHRELARLLIELGCDWALRLDGGGSTTMAARDEDGASAVLNSPIHAGVPGWQRPVANHFGVRSRSTPR